MQLPNLLLALANLIMIVTPILKSLHWLPIKYRIHFKILLLVFKCFIGTAPAYIKELVTPYSPVRSLRSSDKLLLLDRSLRSSKVSLGDGAFERLAPKLWNGLPLSIRSSNSLASFKSNLKTHLFRQAFE